MNKKNKMMMNKKMMKFSKFSSLKLNVNQKPKRKQKNSDNLFSLFCFHYFVLKILKLKNSCFDILNMVNLVTFNFSFMIPTQLMTLIK